MAIQTVTNRKGHRALFDIQRVDEVLMSAARGYESFLRKDEIYRDLEINLYEGMPTSEINKTLIMVLTSRIELIPEYSLIAAHVLLNELASDIIGMNDLDPAFVETYRNNFEKQMRRGVEEGRLDPRLLMFDFTRLKEEMEPSRDKLFDYLGAKTLYDRYFLRDYSQEILELPQYFWMRVAMGLAIEEKDRNASAIEFYHMISQLRYVPSTPTLFHSGTTHPQMSSCYLTTVNDDLKSIFKSFADNSQLAKWSGGIGNDWTSIRGTGAHIKSTNVTSQGVIPFLKISDATTAAINRSGKRRGATCVYLETWHYDIEDFLDLRKNTGDERRRTHDTNTANWIPDLFMKRVIEGGQWTLFSPDEVPDLHDLYGKAFEERYVEYEKKADRGEMDLWKRMPAQELWRKMLTMLFSTGHPWITFKDPSNIRSPQDHVGVVHGSNLCTEITLNTSETEVAVCNIGSVNMMRHVRNGQIDYHALEETVHVAMRMLDNVVDLNYYPIVEAKNSNLRHRPVGLGVMGWHDVLYQVGLPFDTEEAAQLADESMEFISYHAILASSQLAKEKGAYSSFKGSKWDRGLLPFDTIALLEQERGMQIDVPKTMRMDWAPVRDHIKKYGMRNSNTMAIAPTATISNIAGCIPTVEPIYKNMYVKSNQTGEFTVVNEYLVRALREIQLWDENMVNAIKRADGSVQDIQVIPADIRARFKEVFELDTMWIIRQAARRTKWIDQSQSINIFSKSTSGKHFSELYTAAWMQGLKTTYYLRTLGASQVDRATVSNEAPKEAPVEIEASSAPVIAMKMPVGTEVSPETVAVAAAPVAQHAAPQAPVAGTWTMPQTMHEAPAPAPQVTPGAAQVFAAAAAPVVTPVHAPAPTQAPIAPAQPMYTPNAAPTPVPVAQPGAPTGWQVPAFNAAPVNVAPTPVVQPVQQPAPQQVAPQPQQIIQPFAGTVQQPATGEIKLCRLEDPNCESCQ